MRRRLRRMKRTDGFTLIEVLVALTIFSIGGLALTSMLAGSMAQSTKNQQFSQAILIGQEKIESYRTYAYSDLPQQDSYQEDGFDITVVGDVDSENADMTTITVTISWDHKGVTQSYETASIFTNLD